MPGEETYSAEDLLGRRVEHHGLLLGRAATLVFDRTLARVLGIEVHTEGGQRSFLPWPACEPGRDAIEVPRPLSLLSAVELEYYRASGVAVEAGAWSADGDAPRLEDLVVDAGGRVSSGPRRFPAAAAREEDAAR
jgi:hypothetical protein